MDPYQALGVSRGCTRDELKKAFRARAWDSHPDRGGDEQPFIELCTAYKQILNGMGCGPRQGSTEHLDTPRADRGRNPEGPGHRSRSTSNRAVVAESTVPPRTDWVPDLVLDETGCSTAPSRPADPAWEPELVVLDDLADEDSPESRDPSRRYASWIHQVAERSTRGESLRDSGLVQSLGVLLIVALITGGLWLCWVAWESGAMDGDHAVVQGSAEGR